MANTINSFKFKIDDNSGIPKDETLNITAKIYNYSQTKEKAVCNILKQTGYYEVLGMFTDQEYCQIVISYSASNMGVNDVMCVDVGFNMVNNSQIVPLTFAKANKNNLPTL